MKKKKATEEKITIEEKKTVKKEKTKKPAGGAEEWGKYRINAFFGCEHDCKYCYAKTFIAVRGKKQSLQNWTVPIVNEKVITKNYREKMNGRIMFASTHDFTDLTIDASITVFKNLLAVKNDILIVSKPHLHIVKRLCAELEPYKDLIEFRFTIGSTQDSVLEFWETNAPGFQERLDSLKYAYNLGFKTSVSCEPMIDPEIEKLVSQVRPYANVSIWLGKVRDFIRYLKVNKKNDADTIEKAQMLIAHFSNERILELYNTYKNDPLIKFKDSIKDIVGIQRPIEHGLNM